MPPERFEQMVPAENREKPQKRQIPDRPRQETPNVPLERAVEPFTQERFQRVLEQPLIEELPPLDLREVPETPEITMDEISDEELGYQPSFFNRLAKNKWARRAMSALGLAGAANSMKQGVESFQEYDRQKEVQHEIISIAYDSSLELPQAEFRFEHKLDLNEKLPFDDSQMTRGEALNTLSVNFTEQTTGLNGLARNIADLTLSNGQRGIDILRFTVAYGDQVPLTTDALEVLGEVADLTPSEFEAYSKIIRTSVLERADLGNGMFYHDADKLNPNQAPEQSKKLHRERLDQSLELAREAVKSLELDDLTPGERAESTKVIAEAIRETIEADNAWTQAAGYTESWNNEGMRQSFSEKFITALLEASDEAELAWKKVAALDREPDGHLRELAATVGQQLEHKGEAFFEKASQLDPEATVFTEGKKHFTD